MNIPDADLTRVYNRGYEIAFREQPHADGTVWKLAGVRAIAEWARQEALREAAYMVSRMYEGTDGSPLEKAWIGGVDAAARKIRELIAAIPDGAAS